MQRTETEQPKYLDLEESLKPFEGLEKDAQGVYTSKPIFVQGVGQFSFIASPDLEREEVRPLTTDPYMVKIELNFEKPLKTREAEAIENQIGLRIFLPDGRTTKAIPSIMNTDKVEDKFSKIRYVNWVPVEGKTNTDKENLVDNIVSIRRKLKTPVASPVPNPIIVDESELSTLAFAVEDDLESFDSK